MPINEGGLLNVFWFFGLNSKKQNKKKHGKIAAIIMPRLTDTTTGKKIISEKS